ncbi:helix-turn-helix domain-containing protein [Chitinophaga japonensis]|uniref:Helix-turn-helix protein n=1 Tax=Chitinophaga japonensis TaxID=104662 RepID=A0A562T0U8_CHIJA|nr:helix-turn-helix transcriptional regulator [Chitinophaga japonensis]TWI86600.1 helix-turn-helix protein [Chitinophaga japonensis]
MTIGEHIMLLRKQKGLSQADLGKQIGTSGDIIGRYERNIMTPSIEVIIKIADALAVSIDYLVGKTNLVLDKTTLKRLEDINALPGEAKDYILNHIDIMIRDFKNKKTYSHK